MASDTHTEIGIIGGGPAGAALAIRLARMQRRVMLFSDEHYRYGIQGFSERTIRSLEELRAKRALDTLESRSERSVQWNASQTSANGEYLVDRRGFDRALLTDAENSGTDIIIASISEIPRDGEWIEIHANGCLRRISADVWVDARGRKSHGYGVVGERGAPTFALQQALRAPAGNARSGILSVEDGWFWVGILSDGNGIVQQVLDRRSLALSGARGHDLLQSLAKRGASFPAWLLSDVEVSSAVRGYPCTPTLSADVADPVRVGDALLAFDPISGQGVYEAVAGSRNAAAALNTLLMAPSQKALVIEFLMDRARERFDMLNQLAVRAYAREERWRSGLFWAQRQTQSTRLGRACSRPQVLHDVPVVDRDRIIPANVLVTPTNPRGVWRVCDVPVVSMLRELRAGRSCRAVAQTLGVSEQVAAHVEHWLADEIPGFEPGI